MSHSATSINIWSNSRTAAPRRAVGHVHWASDAAEARRIIVEILRKEGTEVIKIKTMTSAEIQLNPALEAAGVKAVETDLAEMILQLGDDEPSHIVVPALHVNRSQVREIFARTHGPQGSDPTIPRRSPLPPAPICATKFLSVDAAICGANFLVAETGAVAIVESEGNGRMCLTLPAHVDCSGRNRKGHPHISRPRSDAAGAGALGNRRADESLHVAVDRRHSRRWAAEFSRRAARQWPLVDSRASHTERQTLRCIRCGACQNTCPVYRQTGGHAYGSVYGGPIGAILTPQLMHMDHAQSLPYASSLVRRLLRSVPSQDQYS